MYPGSFNPPTVAHIAIAAAAREQRSLERVVLVLSRSPINKEHVDRPLFEHRVDVLRAEAARHRWLDVEITEARLLVDIACGYDVLVMGADKWAQVIDPTWYGGSAVARDAAVARLPRVLVAPRAGERPGGVELLDLPDHLADVSATAVRDGAPHAAGWALPEAEG